jgi:DnaJ family protein A protein 2
MKHQLSVTLEDLYKGKSTRLAIPRNVICDKCKGKGGKEGAVRTCPTCNGQGTRFVVRQMGMMIQQIQQPCSDCDARGEIINQKDKCKSCDGKKVVRERKVTEVYIKPGMRDGQAITLYGQGDEGPNMQPGDVIIVIDEAPHPLFKRKNNDLIYEAQIDLITALAGGYIAIKHVSGRTLKVNILPGEVIKPDDSRVISGEGMPDPTAPDHKGNLYVHFTINFPPPNWTDTANIAKLASILPPAKVPDIPKDAVVDDVVLSSMDTSSYSHAQAASSEDEEDGRPSVQCAQQ